MIEYMVIAESNIERLELAVDQYLRERWSLQGGVAVVYLGEGRDAAQFHCFQALTRTVAGEGQ